jgi:quinoprotein glucose dehydrogenase
VKPPYGVLTAIDLNKGEIKFKVPHGDTPDNVRAALERLGISYPEKTGQAGSVGLMVTKTLVVVGDPQFTAPPAGHAVPCSAPTTRTQEKRSALSGFPRRRAVHR